MFPAGAGVVLAVFGLAILAPALVRAGPRPHVEPDVAAAVLASIAAFALVVPAFGLVPATVALVVVSRLADRRGRSFATLGLAAGLSVLAWGVFVVALGVPLAAVRWPW
jgi:MFS family permease